MIIRTINSSRRRSIESSLGTVEPVKLEDVNNTVNVSKNKTEDSKVENRMDKIFEEILKYNLS